MINDALPYTYKDGYIRDRKGRIVLNCTYPEDSIVDFLAERIVELSKELYECQWKLHYYFQESEAYDEPTSYLPPPTKLDLENIRKRLSQDE